MKIYLRSLVLSWFKGIRSQRVDFEDVTNVRGANATGKTSLLDAFLWLLFDKDSIDRKDFDIKTLDENNRPFQEKDHEVTGILDVDGQQICLRKCYREKWVKKRGSIEKEFTGHETSYYWNDVPLKKEEYQQKISDLLNEKVFKLITNTTYFNSMKWPDRRAVLLDIAGQINDSDIMVTLNGLSIETTQLAKALADGKSVEEFKKEISAKKKKLKDELILFPSRIEEAGRALPDPVDYSVIEDQIAALNSDIQSVEDLLNNKSQAAKDHQTSMLKLVQEKGSISLKLSNLESILKSQVREKAVNRESEISSQKSLLRSLQNDLTSIRNEYSRDDQQKKILAAEQESLRKKWSEIDREQLLFNDDEFCCPACKRPFEASDIESKKQSLTANFNASKSKRLTEITDRGKKIGEEISDIDTRLCNIKAKGENVNAEIAKVSARLAELEEQHTRLSADEVGELQKLIAASEEYQSLKSQVTGLDEKINAPYTAEDNSALKQRKIELSGQLDQLKHQLSSKGMREKQLARIEELKTQEATMAQELATLEGTEYCIDQFTKVKMDTLEDRINGRFSMVRFKMFEDQINGGRVEACTTLIGGVPFESANNAARIQAGLDIINTLSDHYGVYAPVWVDNRESVIDLPETKSQLINLIVSEAHPKLTVMAGKVVTMEAAAV